MLVTLNGAGLDFIRDSAFINADFVNASAFKRGAEVSVNGLGPNPNGSPKRDVYLYLETRNMPSVAETLWQQFFTRLFGPPGKRTEESTRAALAKMSATEVVRRVPSYFVHAYHDTGVVVTLDDKKVHRVLQPQLSFGYFVIPHGDPIGWTKSLEGATQITSDWYKIAVPNNGAARVNTSITALDSSPGKKLAIILDLGAAIPHGTFSNAVNTGFSFNAGLEYIFNPRFSSEGILGVHHFPGKVAGDVTAVQFGGGAKVFLNPGHPNLVFVRAGAAGYHFTSGTTDVGGYFGAGLLHQFNAHFGLEGVYTFHAVNTPISATQFSTVQAGVRYVF
jgi:hypothetical protein